MSGLRVVRSGLLQTRTIRTRARTYDTHAKATSRQKIMMMNRSRLLLIRSWSTPCRLTIGCRFSSGGRSGADGGEDHQEDPSSSSSSRTASFAYFPSSVEEQELLVREVSNAPQEPIDVNTLPITFADISRAEVAIRGGVKRTTCERSHFLSELVGANVYFKNEFRQFTGSFKERGARNAILQLMRAQKSSLKGVIAASAGNHALALAYHGGALGIPVTVVMPTLAPMSKVDKCRVRSKVPANDILTC
jgi:Pyridoxal-phosphate dependent enzyme